VSDERDPRDEPEKQDRRDDPDRTAILRRRQRLIAVALAGLTQAGGCGDEAPPQVCLEPPPAWEDPGSPQVCLEAMPPEAPPADDDHDQETGSQETGGQETGGQEAAAGGADQGPKQEPPRVCLRVRPPDPPRPCLSVEAMEPPDPPEAEPIPCLSVLPEEDG
jgi:hypothetical protein